MPDAMACLDTLAHLTFLLALDVSHYSAYSVQVLWKHLLVLHLDAKLSFDEHYHLENPRRVDDAAIEKRCLIFERRRIGYVKVGCDEIPNLPNAFHSFKENTAVLAAAQAEDVLVRGCGMRVISLALACPGAQSARS